VKKSDEEGTWIDGIAASECIDSSGERIEIKGVDISSLTKDGVLNWEHKSDSASCIVGKIYDAKKILKRSECSNDRHRYYWDKVKMPYIYISGQLFDSVGHEQAKEVAAMLRYDQNIDKNSNKNKDLKKLINFSIEGSKLKKEGQVIKKCIARKVSITILPCNKTCEAEAMYAETKKSLLSTVLNKTESLCEIMRKDEPKYNSKLSDVKDVSKPNTNRRDYAVKPKSAVGKDKMRSGSSIKPSRTFTSENAPKKMKVGDRIAYPKKNKVRSGKDLYSDPSTWEGKGSPGEQSRRDYTTAPKKTGVNALVDKKPATSESSDKPKRPKAGSTYDEVVAFRAKMNHRMKKNSDKEMVEEHKQLVDVLESPSHKDDKKEAKKQKKELKNYKKKMEKKQGVPEGADPEVHERCIKDVKNQGKDKSSAFAICNASKAGMKKNKLSKYDSNVRKAIAASCGMGSPSTATNGAALSKDMNSNNNSSGDGLYHIHTDGMRVTSKPLSLKQINETHGGVKRLEANGHRVVPFKGPLNKKEILKIVSDENWSSFKKKEELVTFLSEKLPKVSYKEIVALAKTVAYYSIKKKEYELSKMIEKDMEV